MLVLYIMYNLFGLAKAKHTTILYIQQIVQQ